MSRLLAYARFAQLAYWIVGKAAQITRVNLFHAILNCWNRSSLDSPCVLDWQDIIRH